MATRKVTVTLDEDVYRAIKNNTTNVSAAVNKMAIHYVAMEKQRRALEELDRQLAEQGIEPDESHVEELVAFLDEVKKGVREAYGHDS
jgi:post-segregation antitoxin (ccd killing protein)